VKLMRDMISTDRAQVVLTSHSPSVLGRVEPEEVRHIRRDEAAGVSVVNAIRLPDDESEAFKYVREAVLAHPELYFARLVILCEGESEQVVLPRIARALDVDADQSFVSVAPLGGRHVNHFWRLLSDLDIPHVTLLDFDRERYGGPGEVCDQAAIGERRPPAGSAHGHGRHQHRDSHPLGRRGLG
jgi:predicted ATP-dependent endonuclease of OLD family